MENMTKTASEIEAIVFEDSDDFSVVAEFEIAQLRWGIATQTIVEDENGHYFRIDWVRAATEVQDHEFNDLVMKAVERKVRVIEQVYYEPIV